MSKRGGGGGVPAGHLVVPLRAAHRLNKRLVGEVGRLAGSPDASGGYRRKKRSTEHAAVHALHQRRPADQRRPSRSAEKHEHPIGRTREGGGEGKSSTSMKRIG